MKICSRCGLPKDLKEFCKHRSRKDGHSGICRGCSKIVKAEYRSKNPDKIKAYSSRYYSAHKDRENAKARVYRKANPERFKAYEREQHYGLRDAEFKRLLEAQSNSCAVCEFVFTTEGSKEEAANVDHCHTTGEVRGLLCAKCNKAIGLFKDSPVLLERAAEYLQKKLRDV